MAEKAKQGHSAFNKSEKNGKIYVNVLQWLNEKPDEFGNDSSIQLNPKKDAPETEKKQYIGNMKYIESKGSVPVTNADADALGEALEALPF